MAYSQAWDEAAPIGATTPAASIDTELQNLKISVRERMNDLVGAGNWENDGVDPKTISFDAITLSHVFASASSFTTFAGGSGSSLQPWTEDLNVGADVTIATDVITFDTAGTYLFWVSASVEWAPYTSGGGNLGTLAATGTATILSVPQSFQEAGLRELSLHGVAVATAAQTLSINRIATIVGGTDVCRYNDMSIMILRVA